MQVISDLRTMLDKFGIAAALQEIATLQELKGGENRFKARAYRSGARAIGGYSGDVAKLVKNEKLTSIRGIGQALASQITQLHLTGTSSVLESLRQEFPPGIIELSTVPGLTLTRIRQLHEALGIKSLAELESAAAAGEIQNVKGFGAKIEQTLLEALRTRSKRAAAKKRLHIHHAERSAEPIIEFLQTSSQTVKATVAGSLRRRKETIGTVRIVVEAKDPKKLIDHFLKYPLIVRTESRDRHKCLVELLDGARVEILAVAKNQFPIALAVSTGSAKHVQRLEEQAKQKRLQLDTAKFQITANQRKGVVGNVKSEADFYRRLGLKVMPPELREDEGEIEATLAGRLADDLIAVEDVQGMVHCHTTYSDGVGTVEEMALAAEAMGMKYLTITDHSPTAFYARGVTLDRLARQWDEIAEVQERVKIKLLRGTESDILADGSLDYPDHVLEQFDVIVASIHARYKMDSEKMTARIVTAMRQPVFKIWGHALGRLLERRPPFACDVEKILDVIADSRAAIEINGDPYRLDLEPRWVREARKRKIKFVISVDAHSTGALNNLKYGVGVARRGWVRKREVLNTLGLKAFTAAVRPV